MSFLLDIIELPNLGGQHLQQHNWTLSLTCWCQLRKSYLDTVHLRTASCKCRVTRSLVHAKCTLNTMRLPNDTLLLQDPRLRAISGTSYLVFCVRLGCELVGVSSHPAQIHLVPPFCMAHRRSKLSPQHNVTFSLACKALRAASDSCQTAHACSPAAGT